MDHNFDLWFSYFERLIGVATPIVVAWLGIMLKKKTNRDQEYRELKAKAEDLERQARTDREAELHNSISSLHTSVEDLKKEVSTMKEEIVNIKDLREDLGKLKSINGMILEYQTSQSNVLAVIGEELTSQQEGTGDHVISDAIHEHKENERNLVYKMHCILV